MHNFLPAKLLNPKRHSKSSSYPSDTAGRQKSRPIARDQPKSTTTSPTRARSARSSTLQLSKTSTNSTGSADTNLSDEELDCFRSMRGTSINSTTSFNTAMSSDAAELAERLRTVRQAGERHKKVFDPSGQGYSILVTNEEVRVCHVDEKGEYHYKHLLLPAPHIPTSSRSRRNSTTSTDNSAPNSRTGSTERAAAPKPKPKPEKHPRRQVVRDQTGRTLVDITPSSVTVFHDGGIWRCHRMLGKIWDSDYASHVTARLPRPWSRRASKSGKDVQSTSALDADELARAGWAPDGSALEAARDDAQVPVELLLCSNTPGEKGTAPRAFKSYYHDQ